MQISFPVGITVSWGRWGTEDGKIGYGVYPLSVNQSRSLIHGVFERYHLTSRLVRIYQHFLSSSPPSSLSELKARNSLQIYISRRCFVKKKRLTDASNVSAAKQWLYGFRLRQQRRNLLALIFIFALVCSGQKYVFLRARMFTGTRSVSAKADLHVIISGRPCTDDRDLYRRYRNCEIPLSEGEITRKLAIAAIGIRPRVDF